MKIDRLFLNSLDNKNDLADGYKLAIKNATELYIASAYLTSWSPNVSLNTHCKKLLFIVGTDFGLTRKKACNDVIGWLPKKFYSSFLGAPSIGYGGFHPKIVAWKDVQNKCYCIVGSSNLTEAAFNSNYEANAIAIINEKEFDNIKEWLEGINNCQVVDKGWINQYKERSIKKI